MHCGRCREVLPSSVTSTAWMVLSWKNRCVLWGKWGFSSQVLQQNISCSPTCPFWNKHKNWTCKSRYMNIIEFTEFLSENTCLQNKITFHIYLQINLVFIEWIWYLPAPARIFERFILIQLIICCYSLIIFCVLWLGTQSGCSLRLTELI